MCDKLFKINHESSSIIDAMPSQSRARVRTPELPTEPYDDFCWALLQEEKEEKERTRVCIVITHGNVRVTIFANAQS